MRTETKSNAIITEKHKHADSLVDDCYAHEQVINNKLEMSQL